jgi:hypothetical protein
MWLRLTPSPFVDGRGGAIKKYPDLGTFEEHALILTVLLYLFRSAVPVLKFPFIILISGLLVLKLFRNRMVLFVKMKEFISGFYLAIILLVIMIISFLLSDKLYLNVFKDAVNAVVVILLFFLMTLASESADDLKKFYDRFIRYTFFFSLVICILLILSFFNVVKSGNDLLSHSIIGSLSTDYNFVLIPVFFGIVAVIYFLRKPVPLWEKRMYNLSLLLFSLTIFLSGSRRGFILLAAITGILLLAQLYSFYLEPGSLRIIGINSRGFLISMFSMILLIWIFAFHASYSFKNKTLAIIGSEKSLSVRTKFAVAFYRYASILNRKNTYNELYDQIWFHDFDKSLDPDNGLGPAAFKSISPLTGKNVSIIPAGTSGYMMDNSCRVFIREKEAYSYTLFGAENVSEGDTVMASAYCYVSEDFNGGGVKLCSEGSTYGNNVAYYNVSDSFVDFYNSSGNSFRYLNNGRIFTDSIYRPKNVQYTGTVPEKAGEKRSAGTAEEGGKENHNLFINGDFRYNTLNWIAGADSTWHQIIETPYGKGLRVIRTDGDGVSWSVYYSGRPVIYHAGHRYRITFNYKVEKGGGKPFNIGWWINNVTDGSTPHALPLTVKNLDNGWKKASATYKFSETYYNLPAFLNSLQDFSTVDIADVMLEDLDRVDTLPEFVDQTEEMLKSNKGVWQKLTIRACCRNGIAPVYLYFSKKGVTDFSGLKGYVIFAQPEYKIIRKKKSGIAFSYPGNGKAGINVTATGKTLFPGINDCIYDIRKSENNGVNDQYNSEFQPGIYQGSPAMGVIDRKEYEPVIRTSLFASGIPAVLGLMTFEKEKDPVRKWASSLIVEDTTYHGLKNEINISFNSNRFFGNRLVRWQFALKIFRSEYNLPKKLFGGGFNFLNWFGYYILYDKKLTDYPHNPFLSVLLYSGLIGLIIYSWFIWKVFLLYFRYYREYFLFVIYFLITFFFSFFSAGSPFDPPVMGFFILLPFFINQVHNRGQELILKR